MQSMIAFDSRLRGSSLSESRSRASNSSANLDCAWTVPVSARLNCPAPAASSRISPIIRIGSAPFIPGPPLADGDAFAEAARQIDFPDDRRAALVAALREQNGDSPLLDG